MAGELVTTILLKSRQLHKVAAVDRVAVLCVSKHAKDALTMTKQSQFFQCLGWSANY